MPLDPVTLTFAAVMLVSPPQPATPPPKKAPAVKTAVVQQDPQFGKFALAVLKCYHQTAKYLNGKIEQRPWADQAKYEAKGSALVTIDYLGLSGATYRMTVGVLGKPGAVKAMLVTDNAKVPAYDQCELKDWVQVQ
ncbi:MAG TPA: hypothetical protein VMQ50_14205 [Casimicrobiaceae bacterium]|nr:hypothetical protein [Casimicrobiaceae bacterium]